MKNTFFLLLLCLIASLTCHAQTSVQPDTFSFDVADFFANYQPEDMIAYAPLSPFCRDSAICHIEAGNIKILFPGGFGGMPDFDNNRDESFQAKYKVEFWSQGCKRLSGDDEEGYNEEVFEYLDGKYGLCWRHEIRPDAVGLM